MTSLALYLNLLAMFLLGWNIHAFLRERPDRRGVTYGAIAIAATLTIAVFAFVSPASIPPELVTVLHEGRTRHNVRQFTAEAAHAGDNYRLVAWLLAEGPGATLRDVVRANLWLSALNGLLLAVIAAALVRRWWAVAIIVGGYLASPATLNAAMSEYPAPLAMFYLLLAVPAGWWLLHGARSRRETIAAYLQVLVLGALAAMTREEFGIAGALALAAGLPAFARATPLRGAFEALHARVAGLLGSFAARAVLVVLLVASWELFFPFEGGMPRWLFAGLHPLGPSVLTLPSVVGVLAAPVGLVVLACIGAARGLVQPSRLLALPFTVVVLYRIYMQAGHFAPFEYLRYLAAIVPLLALLAAFGWAELERLADDGRWAKHWPAAVVAALALVSVAGPIPTTPGALLDPARASEPLVPLAADQQREVRYLLREIHENPRCLYVTRVAHDRHSDIGSWDWMLFGGDFGSALPVPASGSTATLEQAVAKAGRGARCVRFYFGLDCNLVRGDGCRGVADGLESVREERFPGAEYNHPNEYGEHMSEVRLATYRVKG